MSNAINVALSKEVALFRQLNVIANNIANASTSGFKKEYVIYNELSVKNGNKSVVYANDVATVINAASGGINYTDRPLDMAIMGDGYFRINSPLGARYTRGGQFRLDSSGNLVDGNFFPVSDNSGNPIVIPLDSEINVNESGEIMVNGSVIAQVGVFTFANEMLLQPVGGGIYKTSAQENQALDYQVISGGYEQSNVQSVEEMQSLIETQRYVSVTNNIINIVEDLEKNAVKSLTDSAKQ